MSRAMNRTAGLLVVYVSSLLPSWKCATLLSVVKGLLSSSRPGLAVSVCVSEVCTCTLLESLRGCVCLKLLRFMCLTYGRIVVTVPCWLWLVRCSGSVMPLVMSVYGTSAGLRKMKVGCTGLLLS